MTKKIVYQLLPKQAGGQNQKSQELAQETGLIKLILPPFTLMAAKKWVTIKFCGRQ